MLRNLSFALLVALLVVAGHQAKVSAQTLGNCNYGGVECYCDTMGSIWQIDCPEVQDCDVEAFCEAVYLSCSGNVIECGDYSGLCYANCAIISN
jgi:hypothetical protein